MTEPVLSVRDLSVEITTRYGVVRAVNNLSYDLYPGETLAIVGETGSGKSISVMSTLRLLPTAARVSSGQILYGGTDLLTLSDSGLRKIRGGEIAMVFQDPMTSLDPVFSIGWQIAEAIRIHQPGLSRAAVRKRVVELLQIAGIPDPEQRAAQYPHEFSGGMRQRAMIAMAIANRPRVLIADEPTTALDVTIQAQVMELLKKLQRTTAASTILITHDLGLVAEMADRMIVMYAGRAVEVGTVEDVLRRTKHPYTLGLLGSRPVPHAVQERLVPIEGSPPSVMDRPTGCAFHPRCRLGRERALCASEVPELAPADGSHASACHFVEEVPGLAQLISRTAGIPIGISEGSE